MTPRLILLLAAFLAHLPNAIGQLSIGKPQWGFDGSVVEENFNPFSIEMRNGGARAFEGDIVLDDGGGFGSRAVAPYRQRVFLAPGTARIVQFAPYIGRYTGQWRLSWEENGRPVREDVTGEKLKDGPPVVVILGDPGVIRRAAMALADEALPATVSATAGLHAVVLDHQPRWDPPRRAAFADWVKRGGVVHLLPGPDGAVPTFTDELAPLNIPADRADVGAGLVVKHKLTLGEITPQALEKAGFPAPAPRDQSNNYSTGDSAFFQTMAGVTKPKISWGLIYLLTVVYVVLIGPVFYVLRKRDYRALLGGFIATVALFAWIFTVVGRRGYGEKQIYHSLAVARALDAGRWDVQHWIHAFATSGDTYRFRHPGGSHLYGTTPDMESIRGEVFTGKEAHFDADMPLFSSRAFLHRGVLAGPDLKLKVSGVKTAVKTALTLDTALEAPDEILKVCIHWESAFYALEKIPGAPSQWAITKGIPGHTPQAVMGGDENNNNNYYPNRGYYRDAEYAASALREMGGELAAHTVAYKVPGGKAAPMRPGMVRVFIYATAPESFRMQSDKFAAGKAYVLYITDLPLPPQ